MRDPKVELLSNGVLLIDYGHTGRLTYRAFRRAYDIFMQTIAVDYPGVKFPHLLKTHSLLMLDFSAARFTRGPEITRVLSAVAVVPSGPVERKIVQLYEHYGKPPYPFRDFASEEEAMQWLEGFIDEQYLEQQFS